MLRARQQWICVAESCSGGLLAAALTDLPGSSAWFAYGWVVYGNEAKEGCLGVDAALIAEHGAVSLEVVQAMLHGALQRSGADWAIATSGIAGPQGGTADKPVGTVCLGLGRRGQPARLERHHFDGDRQEVRRRTVKRALALAVECLNNCT